jgi:uncharacterized protein
MNALVTGASGGIGSAVCVLLVERGWTVLAADLQGPVVLDVRHAEAWEALDLPRLDLLVHCAGVSTAGALAEVSPEAIRTMLEVNLLGPLVGTRACLSALNPGARVVLVGSMLGSHGVANGATYSATKAGLRAFAEALSQEHPELTVVHLQPGVVDTPMAGDMPGERLDPRVVAEQVLAANALHAPVGRDARWFVWLARWAPWVLRRGSGEG